MNLSFLKNLTKPVYFLVAILLVAATFRFYGLGTAEIFHDEGFYAFRSIGYIDYLQNADQTTPVQWFYSSEGGSSFGGKNSLPWWTNLSFHDHPPLFFLIQHFSTSIFGDTLFAVRLPSVLAGLFSIWFIYLIVKKISKGNELLGLLAAALLAVNHIHIWISRSSLMESTLIALILLNIYLFLSFLENYKKYWFSFGLTLGLAFLTKYTAAFLVPAYFIFFLIYKRNIFKEKWLYLTASLTTLIFLPVLIYNYKLYALVSHFDLQFAYLFKQVTPEWRVSLGKVIDPFSAFIPNFFSMYSIPFLALAILGIFYAVYRIALASCSDIGGVRSGLPPISLQEASASSKPSNFFVFFLLMLISITLMLIPLGSAFRFIALYAPFLIIFIIACLNFIKNKYGSFVTGLVISALLIYEIIFSIYGIFITFPDRGIVKLDQYLDQQIGAKASAAIPLTPNPNLNAVITKYSSALAQSTTSLMLIYDENISLSPKLWLFARRLFYHGLTTVTATNFKSMLKSKGQEYFKGYEIYFVRATQYTTLTPALISNDASNLEIFLNQDLKLTPTKIIYGHLNLPMFVVYRFSL